MKYALDYDGTYTACPALWDGFIRAAEQLGHEVVCVTMRYPSEPISMPCRVIYTSRQAKAKHFDADVWIDDQPHWLFRDSA